MSLKDTKFKYYSAQNLDVEKVYGSADTLQPMTMKSVGLTGVDERNRSRRRRVSSRSDVDSASLIWSETSYDVRQLAETFADRFPIIVKVTTGYSNESEDGFTLNVGQVLQVSGDCEQTRLKATDRDQQTLSIPYSMPLTVRLSTSSGLGRIRKLSEVVENSASLPLTVRTENSELTDDGVGLPAGCKLTISAVYQCKFLLTNAIHNGWLNCIDIIIIPEDLSARFTVAVGLSGANSDEWTDYCGMFARAARHLQLRHINGYNGVYWTSRRQCRKSVSSSSRRSRRKKRNEDERLDVEHYIIDRHVRAARPPAYNSVHHRQPPAHKLLSADESDVALGPRSPLMFRSVECLNLLSIQPSSNVDTATTEVSFQRGIPSQSSSTTIQQLAGNRNKLSVMPLREFTVSSVDCSRAGSSNAQSELFSSNETLAVATATATGVSTSNPAAGIKDFAVQVSLTDEHQTPPASRSSFEGLGTASYPPTRYPHMGKLSAVASRQLRKSSLVCSEDVVVESIGGSMPSLQTVNSDSLGGDTLDVEQLTSSPVTSRVKFQTGTCASDGACSLDEGYYTKDSSTSISSAEQSRRKLNISPVYF